MDLVSPDDALLFGLLVEPGRPLVRDQLEVGIVSSRLTEWFRWTDN